LSEGSDDLILCEAIIMMAHRLGMKVIAEGIETPQQRALLIRAGCDYAQGFLFAKSLSAKDLEAYTLQQNQAALVQ
jgi:EAL domain-containing protein (putative c-di-GMP-specific phosphodiesterase class I)